MRAYNVMPHNDSNRCTERAFLSLSKIHVPPLSIFVHESKAALSASTEFTTVRSIISIQGHRKCGKPSRELVSSVTSDNFIRPAVTRCITVL